MCRQFESDRGDQIQLMENEMFGILNDVVKIATAPVKIAVEVAKPVLRETENVARMVTKPVADTLTELAEDAKQLNK